MHLHRARYLAPRLADSIHCVCVCVCVCLAPQVLILANKQDLVNASSADEITAALNLDSIRDRKWQIFPVSAKSGDNLSTSMEWIVECINTPSGEEEKA